MIDRRNINVFPFSPLFTLIIRDFPIYVEGDKNTRRQYAQVCIRSQKNMHNRRTNKTIISECYSEVSNNIHLRKA